MDLILSHEPHACLMLWAPRVLQKYLQLVSKNHTNCLYKKYESGMIIKMVMLNQLQELVMETITRKTECITFKLLFIIIRNFKLLYRHGKL